MIAKIPTPVHPPPANRSLSGSIQSEPKRRPASIYYSDSYLRAVTQLEMNGRLELFRFGTAIIPFVLRPLPHGKKGFDATTPYDFSGPWLGNESAPETWNALCDWACSENIVSAFLRFHPYESSPADWNDLEGLEVTHVADHVRIDLRMDTNAVVASFKPTVRRDLQVANRSNVATFLQPFASQSVEDFSSLYSKTMERCNASEYYKFPRTFFAMLAENLSDACSIATARRGEDVVAAALVLLDGQRAYYYLACSDDEGRKNCAMNRLVHDTAIALAQRGFTQFHLGGGAKGLLEFKKRFGTACVPFHLGRAVFDADRYAELSGNCRSDFFPAYRAPKESA